MSPFFICHPEAKPKGLLRRFFAIAQNDKMISQNAPFFVTLSLSPFFPCHPEAKPKGLLRRRFFADAQNDKKGVRNDRIKRVRMTNKRVR
jgi:hypothetical protein